MAFVDQQVFEEGRGDCLRASVASVLGLQVDEVPNFAECGFFEGLFRWASERGYAVHEIRFSNALSCDCTWFGYHETLLVMWGDGPRKRPDGKAKGHAVVGKPNGYGVKMVHDPHPSRAGLVNCVGVMWLCR